METATTEESLGRPPVRTGVFRSSFLSWRAVLLAAFVCVIIPSSLIGLQIHENPRLSPIDEAAHFDYVSRIAHGSVPRLGQFLLPSTLRLISCTGSAYAGSAPPCPGSADPKAYAGSGYQYEAQQPPTYYAATVPVRWVGTHLFDMSPLTAARAGGALWTSLGLLLLWMAGGLAGVRMSRLVPAMLLLACGPVAVYESAIVSNDAPSLFAGALMAFLGVLAWKRPGGWTFPVLASGSFFVTSLKLDDALAAIVVSGTFGVGWWYLMRSARWAPLMAETTATTPSFRRWVSLWGPNGGALLVGAAVCVVAWVSVNRQLNLIDPRTLPTFGVLRTGVTGLSSIARESVLMLNPLAGSYSNFRTNATGVEIGSRFSQNLQPITATALQYALLAGGVAGLFVRRRTWAHWTGLISLVVLYVGGIALGVGLWRTYNTDPSISGRYGLAVAPLLAMALVVTVRGRWVVAGLGIASVGLVGLTYYYLLAA